MSGICLWEMVFSIGMKESLIPIDKAGRVVLPKEVREELAISAGDLLQISVRGGEVALRPKRESRGFVRRGKALVFSSGTSNVLTNDAARKVIDQVRQERDEQGVRFVSGSKP